MKIRLAVSQARYAELRAALESRGIEIDETADLVLCEDGPFADSLLVRDRATGEKVVVPVDEIVLIETYGHSVQVRTARGSYQSPDRLYKIYARLDPGKFIRVSHSAIVAKDKIVKITPTLSMKFILTMAGGERVDVTRNYYYIFKESFGI